MSVRKILLAITLSIAPLSLQLGSVSAESFELARVNEHILKIRERANSITSSKSENELVTMLEALRSSESYAQSLTEYLIKDYEDGGVDAYTLNLVHEFLKYQITLHDKILDLPSTGEAKILKALQLLTMKKIDDLFFSNKGLRAIYKDQLSASSLNLQRWPILKMRLMNKDYISSLYSSMKTSFYPIDNYIVNSPEENKLKLYTSFQASSLYQDFHKDKNWKDTLLSDQFWTDFSDNTSSALGSVATGASAAFGAVAGNIAWREGYLKEDKTLLQYLEKTVKPFDLLMEKKAYKFTDLTIPGHWGHIGVYLGTKEQLKAMGLWESKFIEPFRENIERGKSIFQVRRTGLVFDSLEDFLNLDEMAILRVQGQSEKSKKELELVFEYLSDQLEKSYDFSFDAMTGETITCTEIVAFSYGPIKWPMDYLLGRYTISPNNMAELALYTDSPLKTISYITGDKEGTHYHGEKEFAKTLGYYKFGDIYKNKQVQCKREIYRHRRTSIRFHYSCEDSYSEKRYSSSR